MHKLLFTILATIGAATLLLSSGVTVAFAQEEHTATAPPVGVADGDERNVITRDSATVLLEGKAIPPQGFIHLYDSTPYHIMNGHVALHVPCNATSQSTVQVLDGVAPFLEPAELELIPELSTPGQLCLFHHDLISIMGPEGRLITDVAIQNPTNSEIVFPKESTAVLGVNEIMLDPDAMGEEHEEMGMNATSASSNTTSGATG